MHGITYKWNLKNNNKKVKLIKTENGKVVARVEEMGK